MFHFACLLNQQINLNVVVSIGDDFSTLSLNAKLRGPRIWLSDTITMRTGSQLNDDSLCRHVSTTAAGEYFYIWFMAWKGTVLAGGVFGMIAAPGTGLFIGPVFAGFFGLPVIVSFAIITWAFWLTRFTILMASLAGGCTGFIATALTWLAMFEMDFRTSLLLASLLGALGGGGATGMYWTKHRREPASNASDIASTWHYSLRDLFFRFTVAAVLIACWAFAVKAYFTTMSAVETNGPVIVVSEFD